LTFPDDALGDRLLRLALPQTFRFEADAFHSFAEKGGKKS
jgi:hypothetical protein